VNWDQRGAGKSYALGADTARMNIAQFVDDIIDLSAYLTTRFGQRKLALVAHSWGTAIAMLALAKRPDLFSAYIGIGQTSDRAADELISYNWTLEQARKAGDTAAERKLLGINPPPYTGKDWRAKYLAERRLLGKFGGEYYGSKIGAFGVVIRNLIISSEYSVKDRVNFFRGIFRSVDLLYPELAEMNLFTLVPKVDVPVFFCLGRHDYEVPSVQSARYFEALVAPRKQLIWFENSAHMPNTEERDRFNSFMIETVLPTIRE
jgi:pimeloyl-ACP methyl ester carboxylesterase